MAHSTKEIMFALIRCAVCGEPLCDSVKAELSADVQKELYSLSKPQDISHIVAEALFMTDAVTDAEIKSVYSKQKMTAVFRYANLRHELAKICSAFDEAQKAEVDKVVPINISLAVK